MIIALASPRIASTLDDGLEKVERLMADASAQGAEIVCFPEAYLPGLRGQAFEVPPFDQTQHERALHAVAQWARTYAIATILGMERITDAGRQIAAYVIDARGEMQGYQTKNQLDPTENRFYVPGNTRQLFEINGVKFGVAICHEGWRYPETVRWAAVRGAKIVFHPQLTGSDKDGVRLTQWGAADAPYYEKAMMMRSIENTIYFASVNYALRFQEAATSLIDPSGRCQAYLPYGQEGVLVQEIDVDEATGLLANRYAPERYGKAIECQSAVPTFLVSDVNDTARWYAQHLGFQTMGIFPPRPPASWASIQRDGAEIMLQRLPGYQKPDVYELRAGGVWNVYIRMRGVKEFYESVRERVPIKMPLTLQPYGNWEFEVVDPNGYVLVFGGD